MSVNPRLNRLFNTDRKCFEVAMDHGVHNEPSFLPGLEDLKRAVSVVAASRADAILLSLGQANFLQDLAGKNKPSLVVRADPTNLYQSPAPNHVFCRLLEEVVEQALALDAASIVANLLWVVDRPELYHQTVQNISRLKPMCSQFGMPLMVESLVLTPNADSSGYTSDSDIRKIVSLVRQAVELGADIVKADPSENLLEYSKVIQAASPRPVLVRGGSRVSDNEILSRTHVLMQQGAAGIVYGRNIYQHSHIERIIRACQAIVHEGASVSEANSILTNDRLGASQK
jgi:class I fructose-bisphosphate aldolase